MVASHAKSASDLSKFWVVQLGEEKAKKPSYLALELRSCRTFCLMKDLIKLSRSLHTKRRDSKKISNLILRPGIDQSTVKLREAVENLGRPKSSNVTEVEYLKSVATIWTSVFKIFTLMDEDDGPGDLISKYLTLSFWLMFPTMCFSFIFLNRWQSPVLIFVTKTLIWTLQDQYVSLRVFIYLFSVYSTAYILVAHYCFPKLFFVVVVCVVLQTLNQFSPL